MDTLLQRLKAHRKNGDQTGINMVDLMMWLVIAALMMAAAIQGIGYYQQAAYLYQVKNDVMGGATKVISLSGIEHNGIIDEEIVGEGLAITQTTAQVHLEADTDPTGKPLIRGTHPGIPGKEVIYFFYPYGKYQPGNTTIAEPGEFLPTAPPRGDVNRNGVPNSTDPDIDGDGTPNEDDNTPNGAYSENLTDPGMGDGVSAATIGTLTGDGSGSFNEDTDYGHPHTPLMANTLTSPSLALTAWSYNQSTKSVSITLSTDGKFTGGTGGSFGLLGHVDMDCYNFTLKQYKHYTFQWTGMLHGPYFGSNPGPHGWADSFQCTDPSYVPSQVIFRTATDAEWAGWSTGRRGDWYTLKDTVEGWVNPVAPKK